MLDIELSALGLEGLALASDGNIADGNPAAGRGICRGDRRRDVGVMGRGTHVLLHDNGLRKCKGFGSCVPVAPANARVCQAVADRRPVRRLPRPTTGRSSYWRGTWDEADATFEAAIEEFGRSRPGMAFEALVRQAELRRRQGRSEEAAALFRQVEFHPFAQLGLAHVALDSGDPALATERAERFLRNLGPESRLQRAVGLDLSARAFVAQAEVDRARSALNELQGLLADVGTETLRASALAVEGVVAEAEGDLGTARHRMEDAIDLFQQSGAPFETAVARIHWRVSLPRSGAGKGRRSRRARAHEAFTVCGRNARRNVLGRSSANSRKCSPGRPERCSPLANSTC